MIQIENLSKVFRTSEVETIALNHVNIEVKEVRGEKRSVSICGRPENG